MYNGGDGNQESTRGSDGEERRHGAGEEAFSEAPQGDSKGRGSSALEGQGTGFVYFIETEDGKFVKIGYSIHPYRRLNELGTSRPIDLRLIGWMPGTFETERWLHHKFASIQERGEWFASTPVLRRFIKAIGLITNEPKCDAGDAMGQRRNGIRSQATYTSGIWRRTNRRERHFVTDGGIVGKLERHPSTTKWAALVKEHNRYRVIGEYGRESRARELVERWTITMTL